MPLGVGSRVLKQVSLGNWREEFARLNLHVLSFFGKYLIENCHGSVNLGDKMTLLSYYSALNSIKV